MEEYRPDYPNNAENFAPPVPPAPEPIAPPPEFNIPNRRARKFGTYFGWLLLAGFLGCLPVLGFILMIVLALSGHDLDRRNFFKAYLLLYVIGIVFVIGAVCSVLFYMAGSLSVWF